MSVNVFEMLESDNRALHFKALVANKNKKSSLKLLPTKKYYFFVFKPFDSIYK